MSAMRSLLEEQFLADWVTSPTAASWHSSSQRPGWADRPLWRRLSDRNGSGHAGPLFKFAAGKRSLQFRFPEAAIRHRVLATPSGQNDFPKAASQPQQGSANRNAPKLPLATSPIRPKAETRPPQQRSAAKAVVVSEAAIVSKGLRTL